MTVAMSNVYNLTVTAWPIKVVFVLTAVFTMIWWQWLQP